jgi:Neprosin
VTQVIYKGAPVNQSVQTATGDVVDGLDRSMLPALPYPLPALPYLPSDVTLPPGVTFGISEVQKNPALADLVSKTAGYRRPDFSPYIRGETDAKDIYDYVDRYQVGGAPKANRLYAGLVSGTANRGASGYIDQFQPDVAADSFSLIEVAVFCPVDQPQEVVGAVISVDRITPVGRNAQGVYDGLPRLHVEYATTTNGRTRYSWDELDGAFVPNPLRRTLPGQVVPVSVLGGATVEHLVTIFQAPSGDWWIAFDQDLLGYYPASKFTLLSGGACAIGWYGEVLNRNPPAGAVPTEMGSGKHAAVGRPNAASVRKPEFYDTSWFSMAAQGVDMPPNVPSCYTRSPLMLDPASGDIIFFLGGPGGKDPVCKWPNP